MKIAILLSLFFCFAVASFGQMFPPAHKQIAWEKPALYISVKDSLPKYQNICAVLLKGKEFNRLVGDACPVLAQYDFRVGWYKADRKPWKTPQISHRRFRELKVSYWYPLPMTNLPGQ
jgi:hypothetical protein